MRIYGSSATFFLAFAIVIAIVEKALSLDCIQCDRQGAWYSPEENERHIHRCQRGLVEPRKCANSSHTHCIFNYYKQGGVLTVTERRCGTAEDMTGCTIYKSTARRMKMRRHLIGGSNTDTPMTPFNVRARHSATSNHRRREATSLLVEVCTGGCRESGCISAANASRFGRAPLSALFSNSISLNNAFGLLLLACSSLLTTTRSRWF